MIGPDAPGGESTGVRTARREEDPAGSLLEDLRAHLEDRRRGLLERIHEGLWEPMRRSADRLGSLRDEALRAEDSLRDAGRAVRVLCDELEERDPAGTLQAELSEHLGGVGEFAHTVPRMMEPGGSGGRSRTVPARRAVRAVLAADYPDVLREELDPDLLVEAPGRALPPSPADLLRPEDHSGRITEAVDRAERHFRLVLEEAAERTVHETAGLLRRGRPLDRVRLRWRRSRAPARRRSTGAALAGGLEGAGERLRELLEARRFTADLARRERALTDAAEKAADRLEAAAERAGDIRGLADRIEDAGRSIASDVLSERGLDTGRLERLESGIRKALDRIRAHLPVTDRPDAELSHSLARFVQLAEALSGVGGGEGTTRTPAARRPAALRDRVSQAVPRIRAAVREAGEIVGHGLRAARSESAVRSPDPQAVAELVRESCERAARKLRDATDLLEETMDGAASEVRSAPERILAELRARKRAGEDGGREGWLSAVAEGARRAARAARELRSRWLAGGPERPPPSEPRAGDGAGRETVGEGTDEGAADRAAGFQELPAIYRWLFRPEPLDDPHLLVGRDAEIEGLRGLRARWDRGEAAAAAVVGSPGVGKTSLLNCGAAELEVGAPVHRGRVDRRLTDTKETVAWFARFFGLEGRPGSPAALAEALSGRRELVLLENAERLYRREVRGYRAVRTLGELIEATAGRLAWVVTFDREAWRVLTAVTGIEGRFGQVLALEALGRRELEEALLARHRLTGYGLRFSGDGAPEERRRAWFDRLHELSGGHPGRALQIWRECLVATEPHEIRALPPRRPCPGRVGALDRETLFVLSALVQHGDLPEEDLPRLLHAPPEQVSERLALLRREGLVRGVPGLPPPAPLQVDRAAYAAVEDRLRDEGLLAPAGGGRGGPA